MNKLMLKTNNFELLVEGTDDFVCEKIFEAAKAFADTIKESGILLLAQPSNAVAETFEPVVEPVVEIEKQPDTEVQSDTQENSALPGTTRGIAQKLNICGSNNSKKGRELLMAAALKLTLENRETFTKKELLSEMKTAHGYYNDAMRILSPRFFNTLCRENKLLEIRANTYSITAETREDLLKSLI